MAARVSADKPARLVLVDDHELARASLQDLLTDERSLEVVGEASSGREGADLCARLRPDLVLMDVRMPDMDGLQATRKIKREYPDIRVLMVTIYEDPDYLLEALKAGAAGYVLKEASRNELISSVLGVLSGDYPVASGLSASLLRRLVKDIEEQVTSPPEAAGRPSASLVEPLTPRELEVLALLAQGDTNRNIAEKLVISRGTVKRHVENLIRKLGVSDRTQAAVRAYELGIITLTKN
jgi:DNA-binding NarL/FixJ family response regulator